MTEQSAPTLVPDPRSGAATLGLLVTRFAVPAWLIFGAVMKFITATPRTLPQWIIDNAQRFSDDPFGGGEAELELVLKAIIVIELVAAGLILFFRPIARGVAIAVLAVFIFVLFAEMSHQMRKGETLIAALSTSCGCFGEQVSLPLWIDLAINLLLVGAVSFLPRWKPAQQREMPKWAMVCSMLWIIGSVQAGIVFAFPAADEKPWQLLNPVYWKGHHFDETPLAGYCLYDYYTFGGGKQTWVFYRDSCPDCHRLFDEEFSGDFGDTVVVAVDVPPAPGAIVDDELGPISCPDCQMNTLREGVDWLINTPTIIYFDENGVITNVRDPKLEEFSRTHREI